VSTLHRPLGKPVIGQTPAPAGEEHLFERRLRGGEVYAGDFLKVQRDWVGLPDGGEASREYIQHPGAVAVVPLLDDGRLVMVRQYRYPVQRVLLEFPAGKIDPQESVWSCAMRELREETGYEAAEWARGGIIHNAAAYADEIIEIWFARGLRGGAQSLDAGEFVDVVLHSEASLLATSLAGELSDVKTNIAFMWLQQWRQGLRDLPWAAAQAPAA
jgi:ADP-ribose pyrophosphatase